MFAEASNGMLVPTQHLNNMPNLSIKEGNISRPCCGGGVVIPLHQLDHSNDSSVFEQTDAFKREKRSPVSSAESSLANVSSMHNHFGKIFKQ